MSSIYKENKRLVWEADTNDFCELVKIAGLDTAKHFRNVDLSGVDFSGCDLGGFDFSGSRFSKAKFTNAKISGARFDKAEINNLNLREAKDWNKYRNNWKRNPNPVSDLSIPTQNIFQDAPFAPELIIIPSGNFHMGSADNEGNAFERPQREVTIDYRFAVGRFAVTFEEWDFYTSRNPNAHKSEDEGWGRDRRPVINISWDDAQAYVRWLSGITGETYRLLSEAEWEYACRAGTDTEFWWGDEISTDQANYHGDYTFGNGTKGEYRNQTVPVDSFQPNPWGLYQMHGNVWEWCEDHYHDNYTGAPSDGSAWKDADDENTSARVLRGGSWYYTPLGLRARYRLRDLQDDRDDFRGFRVARALTSR